jgi:hypothetical protein
MFQAIQTIAWSALLVTTTLPRLRGDGEVAPTGGNFLQVETSDQIQKKMRRASVQDVYRAAGDKRLTRLDLRRLYGP